MTTSVPHELAAAGRSDRLCLLLDLAERVALVVLYAWLAIRLVSSDAPHGPAGAVIVLTSEGLVVLFVLLRRPARQISLHPAEWCLALAATITPLCVRTGSDWAAIPPAFGLTIGGLGIVVQVCAKLSLGRSFGCVPALRGLKMGGPYRFVRHPIYAGYLLTHLGFLALNANLWNLLVYGACYFAQVPRLHAEERLLSRDEGYVAYKNAVPYRLIPGVY